MSYNHYHVALITRDPTLRAVVARERPPRARLCCLEPLEWSQQSAVDADQWWIDLDCTSRPPPAGCQRRVYFYSRHAQVSQTLPISLFVDKSCLPEAVSILWSAVPVSDDPPALLNLPETAPSVPGWLTEFNVLDLREFCHRCVQHLPSRLGYHEIAIYLYDAATGALALAETNIPRPVDLSIRIAPQERHPLAAIARHGSFLLADDLVEAYAAAALECSFEQHQDLAGGGLITPLSDGEDLVGLLRLTAPRVAGSDCRALPLRPIFAFLARSLRNARTHEQARNEARVDGLTGLYNYRWTNETLAREVQRAQRHGSPLSLILIDLDGLKSANDRYGHRVGNALLRHVAAKISAGLRLIDSAARIGGDEFVVVLPATDLAGSQRVAKRILAMLRNDPSTVDGKPYRIAASLGVATWRADWDADQLLHAADQAMYAAKRRGGNRLSNFALGPSEHTPPVDSPPPPLPVQRIERGQ